MSRSFEAPSPTTELLCTEPFKDDVPPLKIAGFGACMISGYPHDTGGLFDVACRTIEESLSQPVISKIVSLPGFSAPRAEKYMRKRLFEFEPHYLILQFGATDALCSVRSNNRLIDRRFGIHARGKTRSDVAPRAAASHSRPVTLLSLLRWQLASAIGYFKKIEPTTPLPLYIASVERMIAQCRSAEIKAVVLSPFVYGSRYAMKRSIPYFDALRELQSMAPDLIVIDCFALLAKLPKSKILQHDGFHLSRSGHVLVGEAIGRAIVTDSIGEHIGNLRRASLGLRPDKTAAVQPLGIQDQALTIQNKRLQKIAAAAPRGCYALLANAAACLSMYPTNATTWSPASVSAYRS